MTIRSSAEQALAPSLAGAITEMLEEIGRQGYPASVAILPGT